MTNHPPLKSRIRTHWHKGIAYQELMWAVFPPNLYPRSYRNSHNGGPPGCAMAFGKALRELGLRRSWEGNIIEGSPLAL